MHYISPNFHTSGKTVDLACQTLPSGGGKHALLLKKALTFCVFDSLQVLVKRKEEHLLFLLYPGEDKMETIATLGTTPFVYLPDLSFLLRSLCFDLQHVVQVRTATCKMDLKLLSKNGQTHNVEFTSCASVTAK